MTYQPVNLLSCMQVTSSICYISMASQCWLAHLATFYHAYKSLHQCVTFLMLQSANLQTCWHPTLYINPSINVILLRPQSADLMTCQPTMHTSPAINILHLKGLYVLIWWPVILLPCIQVSPSIFYMSKACKPHSLPLCSVNTYTIFFNLSHLCLFRGWGWIVQLLHVFVIV